MLLVTLYTICLAGIIGFSMYFQWAISKFKTERNPHIDLHLGLAIAGLLVYLILFIWLTYKLPIILSYMNQYT